MNLSQRWVCWPGRGEEGRHVSEGLGWVGTQAAGFAASELQSPRPHPEGYRLRCF